MSSARLVWPADKRVLYKSMVEFVLDRREIDRLVFAPHQVWDDFLSQRRSCAANHTAPELTQIFANEILPELNAFHANRETADSNFVRFCQHLLASIDDGEHGRINDQNDTPSEELTIPVQSTQLKV